MVMEEIVPIVMGILKIIFILGIKWIERISIKNQSRSLFLLSNSHNYKMFSSCFSLSSWTRCELGTLDYGMGLNGNQCFVLFNFLSGYIAEIC
jgi:hypothetical protein